MEFEKEITVTLKSGREVTSNVLVTYSEEHGYGADADGNRGISATFIDNIECGDLEEGDDGEPLSLDEKVEAYARFEEQVEGMF